MPNFESHRTSFDTLTIPEPNSGCLLWLGSIDTNGYGRVWNSSTRTHFPATHLALYLAGRKLPRRKIACHTCDNPSCVEQVHLFHGTMKDNTHDMMSKGRANTLDLELGRSRPRKPEGVKERAGAMYLAGEPIQKIAKETSTDPGTIRRWCEPLGYTVKPYFTRTECPQGHLLSPENTYMTERDGRICKQCCLDRYRRKMAKLGLIATKRVFKNR